MRFKRFCDWLLTPTMCVVFMCAFTLVNWRLINERSDNAVARATMRQFHEQLERELETCRKEKHEIIEAFK